MHAYRESDLVSFEFLFCFVLINVSYLCGSPLEIQDAWIKPPKEQDVSIKKKANKYKQMSISPKDFNMTENLGPRDSVVSHMGERALFHLSLLTQTTGT